jgi:ABC-type multidrug transport system fused ATPase/permease subunit
LKPISFVLTYVRKYTRVMIFTIAAMIVLVGLQLLVPWIIDKLLTALQNTGATADTLHIISMLSLLVLIVFIVRAGLTFVRMYLSHVAGWGVVADVRKYIYERMQRFTLRFYEDKQTGQLMTRVVDDTGQFEDLIAHAVPDRRTSGVVLPQLATGTAFPDTYPVRRTLYARLRALCAPRLPRAPERTG